MQITIKQNELQSVAYAMAVKDIRYYLNGVLLELNGVLLESNGAETRLVATDGHRLHAVVSFDDDALVVDPVQIILPDTFVKTLLKAKFGRHGEKVFTFNIDGDKVSCVLPDGMEIICKGIDGTFPDYLRVIPKSCTGEYRQCNPEYIMDAHDAYRAYFDLKKACPPDLVYNGDGAAMLAVDRFIAIVMPWRGGDSHDAPHEAFSRGLAKPEVKLAAEG